MEELKAPFEELEGIYRVMVYVGGVTGLRVSEVIGLHWSDCDFEVGEIRLKIKDGSEDEDEDRS